MSTLSGITEDPFVTPQSTPEELNVEIAKHGGGRPKSKVWEYFEHNSTNHPGHFDAKCKFCNYYWKGGVVKKLEVHLARECDNVSAEIKNKYMHIVAKRDGLSDDIMEIETSQITDNERNKDDALSLEQAAFIDRSVLKAFVMCGLPFRIIENPYFINILKNLKKNYNPPSRERLSTNLLSEECVRVELKINNLLENSKNLSLGMKLF
jgi:hypothetical protein